MDEMRSLRKDMEHTKTSVKIISDKVDSVEKGVQFQSEKLDVQKRNEERLK